MEHSSAKSHVSGILGRLPSFFQWLLLVFVSSIGIALLEIAGLPAAALIGPMLAGVLAGLYGATIRVPFVLFAAAQAVLGILIASSVQPEILVALQDEWFLFLAGVLSTLAASSYLGWLISRWKILPGTTAVWGSAPGAATAMVLMAGAFGADERYVAFMQYLRVLIVAIFAAAIAVTLNDGPAAETRTAIIWFPRLDGTAFASSVIVACAGAFAGRLLRLPSPFFLGAMILGMALHLTAGVAFQLPHWLLVITYALVGWTIGLKFTRPIVRHAARALPQIVASILALMLFCGGMAFLLSQLLGIDPLTAYLATSPGGMDSVAIIAAASSQVNMSFVMAMQMARFLIVLLFGPAIARMVAKRVEAQPD